MREVRLFGGGDTLVLVHGVEDAEAERLANALNLRIAVPQNIDWNADLSPWPCPKVFKKGKAFTGEGEKYLRELQSEILPKLNAKRCMIAGYSMAGMFAIWAGMSLGGFEGIASASGSLWFPGFMDWMRSAPKDVPLAYLSVGDTEKNGRNPAFSCMEDRTREAKDILEVRGTRVIFELNPGNHFTETEKRLEKAIRKITEV